MQKFYYIAKLVIACTMYLWVCNALEREKLARILKVLNNSLSLSTLISIRYMRRNYRKKEKLARKQTKEKERETYFLCSNSICVFVQKNSGKKQKKTFLSTTFSLSLFGFGFSSIFCFPAPLIK